MGSGFKNPCLAPLYQPAAPCANKRPSCSLPCPPTPRPLFIFGPVAGQPSRNSPIPFRLTSILPVLQRPAQGPPHSAQPAAGGTLVPLGPPAYLDRLGLCTRPREVSDQHLSMWSTPLEASLPTGQACPLQDMFFGQAQRSHSKSSTVTCSSL